MNKKFNILFMAFLMGVMALATTSCESDMDNNPVFQKPTSFVLNTPKYASGLYDLKNTDAVQLTCSQPNYPYAAATVYHVEVSASSDFANPVELTSTYRLCKMDVNANELAIALNTAYGVIDESTVPAEAVKAYVRLRAELPNVGDESVIYSNIIELPNVLLYYALPDVVLPEQMYMIGGFNGWDWGSCAKMVVANANPDKWWTIRYIDDQGFKFNWAKSWDGNEVGFSKIKVGNDKACGGLIDAGGNVGVTTPGWYIIGLTVGIEGRDYTFTVDVFEPNVYIFGATNGGIWEKNDAWKFSIPTEKNGVFVSPALVAGGEVRMCICPDWAGLSWWQLEFTLKGGSTIYYRENDAINDNWAGDKGAEYSITGAAGTVITLDFANESGSVK